MTDPTLLPLAPDLATRVAFAAAEPLAAPVVSASATVRRDPSVRAIEPRDIPGICDLFAATFRPGRAILREAVERSLASTYLTAPGDRVRPASQVYVGPGGSVDGFMGVTTLAARFRGRALRCGILGSFMGREPDRARAGLKLSRATFALDLDLMFSDTANRNSVDLSRSFGFDVLPAHSLGWLKILRPVAMGAAALVPSRPGLAQAFVTLARPVDRLAGRLPHVSLPPEDAAGSIARLLAAEDLAARARPLLARYALSPAWDESELGWLLDGARRHTTDGALQMREVFDRRGRAVGLFLLYAKPGGVARVLHVLAERGREPAVLAALIREAAALGATAIQGRTSPAVSAGLLWQRGIFYRRAAAAIGFARDPAVHAALLSDTACLGGLFGETWALPDDLG